MNTSTLSLTKSQGRAVRNIIQSLKNARAYCSWLEGGGALESELEEMIDRFVKRVEKKIDENY